MSDNKIYKNIDNLKLIDVNPRFTNYKDINWKFLAKNGNKISQKEIALEILSYEEDFSSFITLLKSLSGGFRNDQDRLICLKHSTKNNYEEFLVLEGNRRVLASKMIKDKSFSQNLLISLIEKQDKRTFNTLEQDNFDDEDIIYDQITEDLIIKSKNSSIKNLYQTLIDIWEQADIESTIETFNTIEIVLYELEDLQFEETIKKIWSAIFGRSVSAPGGKRKWPRYQTLKNTWDVYWIEYKKIKEYKKTLDKIAKIFNRSSSALNKELDSAQLIFLLKKYYTSDKLQNEKDWKNLRTSAIELSLDSISLREIEEIENSTIKKEFNIQYNLKNQESKEDLKFQNIENIDNFEDEKDFCEKLSSFLIDNFLVGNYSTRGWKDLAPQEPIYNFLGLNFKKFKNDELEFAELEKNPNHKTYYLYEKINDYSKKLISICKSVSKYEINLEENTSNDNNYSDTILIKVAKRILFQEIKFLLPKSFKKYTISSFPFFSFAAIARSFFESSYTYIIANSLEYRKHLFKNCDLKKQDYKTIFHDTLKDNNNNFLSNKDFQNKIFNPDNFDNYNKFIKYTNWSEIMRTQNKIDKYRQSLNCIQKDPNCLTLIGKERIQNFSNMIDLFYDKNNIHNDLLNKSIHTPHYFVYEKKQEDLIKMFVNSLFVIKYYLTFLGMDLENILNDIEINPIFENEDKKE